MSYPWPVLAAPARRDRHDRTAALRMDAKLAARKFPSGARRHSEDTHGSQGGVGT